MKLSYSAKKRRKNIISGEEIISHELDCRYVNRSGIPLDECMCDCYDNHVFKAGYEEGLKD